jgi:hypothetical protein
MTGVWSPAKNYLANWAFRLTFDGVTGIGQSAFYARERGRFDSRSFLEGVEYTIGSVVDARMMAGFGWRPYDLSLDDVEAMRSRLTSSERVLVFKMKTNLNPSFHVRFASPLGDALDKSLYHEVLVGVTKNDAIPSDAKLFINESGGTGGRFVSHPIPEDGLSRRDAFGERYNERWGAGVHKSNLRFVGEFDRGDFVAANRKNPLQIRSLGGLRRPEGVPNPYRLLWRNCQNHVTAVLKELQRPH